MIEEAAGTSGMFEDRKEGIQSHWKGKVDEW
jgi:hypothetical protein